MILSSYCYHIELCYMYHIHPSRQSHRSSFAFGFISPLSLRTPQLPTLYSEQSASSPRSILVEAVILLIPLTHTLTVPQTVTSILLGILKSQMTYPYPYPYPHTCLSRSIPDSQSPSRCIIICHLPAHHACFSVTAPSRFLILERILQTPASSPSRKKQP